MDQFNLTYSTLVRELACAPEKLLEHCCGSPYFNCFRTSDNHDGMSPIWAIIKAQSDVPMSNIIGTSVPAIIAGGSCAAYGSSEWESNSQPLSLQRAGFDNAAELAGQSCTIIMVVCFVLWLTYRSWLSKARYEWHRRRIIGVLFPDHR